MFSGSAYFQVNAPDNLKHAMVPIEPEEESEEGINSMFEGEEEINENSVEENYESEIRDPQENEDVENESIYEGSSEYY